MSQYISLTKTTYNICSKVIDFISKKDFIFLPNNNSGYEKKKQEDSLILISKIIRTKDNHLLYVLGKTNDDMTLKELMKIEPIFTSSVSNEYSVLNYKVIKVGDKND